MSKLNNKECFRNSECSNIIKAHSIQENKILKKIAINSHVAMVEIRPHKNNTEVEFEETPIEFEFNVEIEAVGKGKATTFQGFCKKHDQDLFKLIESGDYRLHDKDNKKQNLLFAYRALAKEFHAVKTGLIRLDIAIKDAVDRRQNNNAIDNNDFEKTIQSYNDFLSGRQYFLQKIESIRQDFNYCIDRQKVDIIETQVLIFEEEYHIAVSSAFTMDFDINGNAVNRYSTLESPSRFFFLTIFPQENKTYILFSYLREDGVYLERIVEDISRLNQSDQKIVLSNIIAIQVENFCLSPMLWKQIPGIEKEEFLNLFKSTITAPMYNLKKRRNINFFRKIE